MGTIKITPETLVQLAEAFERARDRTDAARGNFSAGAQHAGHALGNPRATQAYERGVQETVNGVTNLHDALGNYAAALRAIAGNYTQADRNAAARSAS